MGYEPPVNCRNCDGPLDVWQPHEDRFCSDDCREAEKGRRAVIGVDGNCAFALVGDDLQVGESEWVEIESSDPARYHSTEWCEAANRASRRALAKLRERLGYDLRAGKWLSYALHSSHPNFV